MIDHSRQKIRGDAGMKSHRRGVPKSAYKLSKSLANQISVNYRCVIKALGENKTKNLSP